MSEPYRTGDTVRSVAVGRTPSFIGIVVGVTPTFVLVNKNDGRTLNRKPAELSLIKVKL